MVHVLIWMHVSSIIQAPIWILLLLEINAIIVHIMYNAYLLGTQPNEQLRWCGSLLAILSIFDFLYLSVSFLLIRKINPVL